MEDCVGEFACIGKKKRKKITIESKAKSLLMLPFSAAAKQTKCLQFL